MTPRTRYAGVAGSTDDGSLGPAGPLEGNEAERRLAFAETHRMLHQRISIFTSLPLASLDRLSLQKRLDQISSQHA